MIRYACLHDLNNYFKKKDLLGGLTELEQRQLRKNIGIIDQEGGLNAPLEVTYENMYKLITGNNLVTGAIYIITDFQTIYSSNVVDSSGRRITWGDTVNPSEIYKLLVRAIDTDKLDTRVFIQNHTNWVVEYDVTKEILEDGVSTKGKITYLRDDNYNSAFYDFKNIRIRKTYTELANTNLTIQGSYIDLYTFSDITDGVVTDSSYLHNTKHNEIKQGCINNIFIGDTYNNIVEADCKNNIFIRGCHDTILQWNSSNNVFNEDVCYLTGALYNKTFNIGDTTLSTTISKTVHKVNEATIVSFLDPITYAYQVIQI